MKEKQILYFALGISTVLLMGQTMGIRNDGLEFPDGSVQMTAAGGIKGFYLTDSSSFDGMEALTACAAGYHMASLWEILDVSNLRYASEAPGARSSGDDGPVPAALYGWIRTGNSPNSASIAGTGNCDFYSQNTTGSGTLVALSSSWTTEASQAGGPNGWLGPWLALSTSCISDDRVWCVQD